MGNMGFGSLLLYTYPDGNNNRHHSNWSEERELNIVTCMLEMHTHQKKKKSIKGGQRRVYIQTKVLLLSSVLKVNQREI